MVQTIGITKAITNLNKAHDKFSLSQTDAPQFFTEWFEALPDITESDKEILNCLKNRLIIYISIVVDCPAELEGEWGMGNG